MDPAIHDYFLRAHAEGQLLSADQPAATIASLVLRDITDEQRATYNGAFVSWNDEALLRVLRLS